MTRSKPLPPGPEDCVVCAHFGYVQQSPGRWYPCPACHGSGRADLLGSQDPSLCVRDSTLDPNAYHAGTGIKHASDTRTQRKRARDRAAGRRRRERSKEER